MQTKFISIDEKRYVIDPKTAKSGGKRTLSVNCSGVSHIIMITDPLMRGPDAVFGTESKKCISEIVSGAGKNDLNFQNKELGTNGLQISFINYVQYQIKGQAWEVADKAQRIFVCGAFCNDDELTVYLPTEAVNCYTDIKLEMKYKRVPFKVTETEKRPFGKTVDVQKDTGYEIVMFEKIMGYSEGMISYDVDIKGHKYTIPITEEMTGKPFMIKRVTGMPLVFNADGLTLSQVKEIK